MLVEIKPKQSELRGRVHTAPLRIKWRINSDVLQCPEADNPPIMIFKQQHESAILKPTVQEEIHNSIGGVRGYTVNFGRDWFECDRN